MICYTYIFNLEKTTTSFLPFSGVPLFTNNRNALFTRFIITKADNIFLDFVNQTDVLIFVNQIVSFLLSLWKNILKQHEFLKSTITTVQNKLFLTAVLHINTTLRLTILTYTSKTYDENDIFQMRI